MLFFILFSNYHINLPVFTAAHPHHTKGSLRGISRTIRIPCHHQIQIPQILLSFLSSFLLLAQHHQHHHQMEPLHHHQQQLGQIQHYRSDPHDIIEGIDDGSVEVPEE